MLENEMTGSQAEGPALRLKPSPQGISPNRILTLGVLAGLFAFFSLFANNFFTVRGVLNLLVQTSTFALLGIGATLVLTVGGIDYSAGAVVAFTGTAAVVFSMMGIPVWLAMTAAASIGGLFGFLNGFLVVRMRLPSLLTTFSMAMVIYGILGFFGSVLSAAAVAASIQPPPALPESFGYLANVPVFAITSHAANGAPVTLFPGVSWIVIIMAIVAVFFHLLLTKTRIGRFTRLAGSNTEASRLSGIQVVRVKITVFVLAGMLAGLVGDLLASRLMASPGGAVGYETTGIICAMIGGASLRGGVGSIGGTVIGAFILSTLAMGLAMMNNSIASLPILLDGVIILGAVYLDQARNRG